MTTFTLYSVNCGEGCCGPLIMKGIPPGERSFPEEDVYILEDVLLHLVEVVYDFGEGRVLFPERFDYLPDGEEGDPLFELLYLLAGVVFYLPGLLRDSATRLSIFSFRACISSLVASSSVA